jgi:hypothetical protein
MGEPGRRSNLRAVRAAHTGPQEEVEMWKYIVGAVIGLALAAVAGWAAIRLVRWLFGWLNR